MPPRVNSTRREFRKGKKRALPDAEEPREKSSSLSPPPELPKAKKSKKGDTRQCPVCDDDIPVRLLAQHAELELYRVDELLRSGPSTVVLESEPGPSTSSGRRGAAVKARKSLSTLNHRPWEQLDSIEQTEKTLRLLKRNRKQRHARLKEIIAQDDDEVPLAEVRKTLTCPVCLTEVLGDRDVVDAHVDACLANAHRQQAEAEQREALGRAADNLDPWGEVEVNGEIHIRLANTAGLRGTGIEVRDRTQVDVEEDVDVDGDDVAVFGDAQFTERDVLPLPSSDIQDGNVPVEVDDERDRARSLRALLAEGKVISRQPLREDVNGVKAQMEEVMGVADADRMDQAVRKARLSGNTAALVLALESKIKPLESMRVSSSTSSLCRICIDPYNEPTVSTGCWHTCCRECWLRCLGSTKLCPICKRITAPTDLRRIYM